MTNNRTVLHVTSASTRIHPPRGPVVRISILSLIFVTGGIGALAIAITAGRAADVALAIVVMLLAVDVILIFAMTWLPRKGRLDFH